MTDEPKSNSFNVGLVMTPFNQIGADPAVGIIEILAGASNQLFITTGSPYIEKVVTKENVHVQHVQSIPLNQYWLIRVLKFIPLQLKTCINLMKIAKSIDIVVFYAGGISFTLPLLLAKLMGKKIISIVAGSQPLVAREWYRETIFGIGGTVAYYAMKVLEWICFNLSDRIAVGSENLVRYFEIGKYRTKIVINNYCHHYINSRFQVKKDWHQRGNVVGYIGRLSREKGVLQLAKAIPLILAKKKDVRFLIVGDGQVREDLKEELKRNDCLDKVRLAGWCSPDMVVEYLNEMKFHILPSYSEAEGGTSLEAMACGTVSITNSVGGLPDFVIDGVTGFLLKNNEPQTIADKVIEVWDHHELDVIREKARLLISEKLSYEKTVTPWRQIFADLDL